MNYLHATIFAMIFACADAKPCHVIVLWPRPPPPRPPPTQKPPANTCPPNVICNNTNGIDPRTGRLTMCNGGPCRSEKLQMPECGKRFITSVNPNDGESTYGAYPWQAFLSVQNQYIGSGALIDRYHVITAAHKVIKYRTNVDSIQVLVGVHNPAANPELSESRTVASVRIHREFDQQNLKNDIAVLRLKNPIPLGYKTNVGTICLPPSGKSYVGQRCSVSGWGTTSFGANDASRRPQRQVAVQIVSQKTCRASMAQQHVLGSNVNKYLDDKEICAGGEYNKDACSHDGGAPLVCLDNSSGRFHVSGLVIWGKGCGKPNVYGVYVDVAKYRNWIDLATNDFNG